MNCLAIIPARSGSKGYPDKNIAMLNGKPLMYYTIHAAALSHCFSEIMVSTDSEKYARIARECGATVPFLRSRSTSEDNAGSWDVVREVLDNYSQQGRTFDYIGLLQPTSPLRELDDIQRAFALLSRENVHNVVSVAELAHPIQWCFRLPEDRLMDEAAQNPDFYKRRQELEPYYIENGSIYLVDANKITDKSYNFYTDQCAALVMSRDKSVDIDTAIDLKVAEIMIKNG